MVREEIVQEAIYNFGLESWKLGQKLSKIHRDRNTFTTPAKAFSDNFPGILEIAKGDRNKEIILFYCIHTFAFGYRYPGFKWDYVESQCNMILHSNPGDECRKIFY